MKAAIALGLVSLALALPATNGRDDFKRERKQGDPRSAAKDALEGKAPPPLVVEGWMNTDGKPLRLADLRGKVVVLKFWGVW